MIRLSKPLILTLLVAGAVFFPTPPPADAAFKLRLNDGVNPAVTITDGDINDSGALTGLIVFNGGIGNWIVNVTVGSSKPIFPNTPHEAKMDLASMNIRVNGAGALTIELTDTDFNLAANPTPYFLRTEFGGTISGGTVGYESFVGLGNGEFETSGPSTGPQGPFGPGAFANSTSTPFIGTNPFSMTQRISISVGAGVSNFSGDLETRVVTPAPSSLLLAGLGLPFLGLAYWYKRKPAAALAA